MKKKLVGLLGVVALTGLLLAVAAMTASAAAPVRECGSAGRLYDGAVRLVNVTTRNVLCRAARRFARAFEQQGCVDDNSCACAEDRYCTFRRYVCRNVATSSSIDHRCVRGRRVIRWQARF